ncbi:hypothetical protein BKA82DRAFT_10135 [Pisolithus tinctorius]|uniref:Uncharacterized protein n=1 Tax=Pisolithus tinctorius Marx 270 TaxID=870435 RepID=A0A0C3P0H5_PISTI|nr:hypothetical protein BKA82DRAFT_10135 [Pisolithus tinctorius]KIO00814.1 hypothetical protein M404DRAFT_10135 [Pisolithus tinctorius Marx 270]
MAATGQISNPPMPSGDIKYDDGGNSFVHDSSVTFNYSSLFIMCSNWITTKLPAPPKGPILNSNYSTKACIQVHQPLPAIDPAFMPLPSGQDDDLIILSLIAQSQGRAASPKIAGSHCPGKGGSSVNKSRASKGKEKENIGVPRSKKWQQDVIDLDDEEETKMKCGQP